jgi:DNA-binding MarR family transcriptional regulator
MTDGTPREQTEDSPARLIRPREVTVHFRAWRRFLGAYNAVVPQIENALSARRKLPLTWYDVLFQLNEAPGQRLHTRDLANALLLSSKGIPRLIDRIRAAGLVSREAVPGDPKSNLIVLTADGQKELTRAIPIVTQAIHTCFADHMSEEDAEALVRILGRVQDVAGQPVASS